MSNAMTVKDWRGLSQRDWDNGAVRDEIYQALRERESLRAAVMELFVTVTHYKQPFGGTSIKGKTVSLLKRICHEHGIDIKGLDPTGQRQRTSGMGG